ncbi:MAG: CAP domain-containing protein [bacterium]|nr:CAP domain-containing protein [bacterium]
MNKLIALFFLVFVSILFLSTSNTKTVISSHAVSYAQLHADQIQMNQPSFNQNNFSPLPDINSYFNTPKPASSTFPIPTPSATPLPTPIQSSSSYHTTAPSATASSVIYSDEIVRLVNEVRVKNNLSKLSNNTHLQKAAQDYATSMAELNFFSHTGKDHSTFVRRISSAGYTNFKWVGENIAAGQTTPQAVMQAWMNSQGHKANILNVKAQDIGVGYAYSSSSTYKRYWVQDFGAI